MFLHVNCEKDLGTGFILSYVAAEPETPPIDPGNQNVIRLSRHLLSLNALVHGTHLRDNAYSINGIMCFANQYTRCFSFLRLFLKVGFDKEKEFFVDYF